MYGLVNLSLQTMVINKYGEDSWKLIKNAAEVEDELFSRLTSYDDAITYRLVGAASKHLNIPTDEFLELFGLHWITVTALQDYGELICAAGANLREFLLQLPHFHTRVTLFLPKLQPPEFSCRELGEKEIELKYFSRRAGLAPFVLGVLRGVGHVFKTKVTVAQTSSFSESGQNYHKFHITWS
jgi:hypothetical protein